MTTDIFKQAKEFAYLQEHQPLLIISLIRIKPTTRYWSPYWHQWDGMWIQSGPSSQIIRSQRRKLPATVNWLTVPITKTLGVFMFTFAVYLDGPRPDSYPPKGRGAYPSFFIWSKPRSCLNPVKTSRQRLTQRWDYFLSPIPLTRRRVHHLRCYWKSSILHYRNIVRKPFLSIKPSPILERI